MVLANAGVIQQLVARLFPGHGHGRSEKAQPETIRILVWLLSFLGFGYATAEFEVTSERLGVYRPEEHIEYGIRPDRLQGDLLTLL